MQYRANKYKSLQDLEIIEDASSLETPNLREFYYNNYYSTSTTQEQILLIEKFLKLKKQGEFQDIQLDFSIDELLQRLNNFKTINYQVKSFNLNIENLLNEQSEIDDMESPLYQKLEKDIYKKLTKRQERIRNLEGKQEFFEKEVEEKFGIPEPLQPHQIINRIKKLPYIPIELGNKIFRLVNLVPHPIFFYQKEKHLKQNPPSIPPEGYTISFAKKSGAYIRKSSPLKRMAKILQTPYQAKSTQFMRGDIQLYSMPTKGELFIYFGDPNTTRDAFDWECYGEFPPSETIDDELSNYIFYTSKLTNCAKIDTYDQFIVTNNSTSLIHLLEKICNKESKNKSTCENTYNKMLIDSGLDENEKKKARLIKSFIYADGICDCIVKCDEPTKQMTTADTRKKLMEQPEDKYTL